MNWTVVIPYRWTDPARAQSFDFVRAWWDDMGYPVLVGGQDPSWPPWSKGAAVGSVRADVQTDGLIIADCDVLVTGEAIGLSKAAVASGAAWVQPHGSVIRLNRPETLRIYRMGPDAVSTQRQRAATHRAPAGGGLVFLTVDAYDTVRGIDPRFCGWGGEDISFARALDTLVGYGLRLGGILWHLWHPRTPRRAGNRANVESERIAAAYLDAEGDPVAMRALVDRLAP